MSVDRCGDSSVDPWRIPFPREMMEKSIFHIKNGSVFCSSFLLIIFIILLCMHGVSSVCRHGGIVVVVLTIAWTTVNGFFLSAVNRFLVGTIDRWGGVSFDRRRIFCLILSSTAACCNESRIINSSGGRLWLHDWNRSVVDMGIDKRQAQLFGLNDAHCSYC
ncbi:hypothetical protein F2Q70_00004208 [Brassica cretica]|uniref:Transmembrane protein n=1 Tax=Brassica cretica TaxID=69181 RepID=A0A8S9IX63_BRACR|nr:hypothetical protein F2Q70_00004208 [Brassica cretica]